MKSLLFSGRQAFFAAATLIFTALASIAHAQYSDEFSVKITNPTNHSTFPEHANIQFDASVSPIAPFGKVAYVSFQAALGDTGPLVELGVVSNSISSNSQKSTYSFVWTNVPYGTDWLVWAVAVGSDGTETYAIAIEIAVTADFSIAITSPTNGATFPEPTNISLIAALSATNGTVTNVNFFDGNQRLGSGIVIDASPGGNVFMFDWSNSPVGYHSITATATDTNGAIASSQPINITVDNGTNSLTITQPTNGSTFMVPVNNIQFGVFVYNPPGDMGSVNFTATQAGDSLPLILLLGTVSNFTSLDPSTRFYTFTWTNALIGTWNVQASASTTNGTFVGSSKVQIIVQRNTSLSVAIDYPTNGEIFPTPTDIRLNAFVPESNIYPVSVEFFDNGNPIGVDPFGSFDPFMAGPLIFVDYFFDWTNQSLGSHLLTAVASDSYGDSVTSDPVLIHIGNPTNPPPTVQFTRPTNGATFVAPANIQFAVSVYDPAGEVGQVNFTATQPGDLLPPILFLGTVSNFTSLDPPTRIYTFTWSNALLGTWNVQASASTTNGNSIGSAKVQITVQRNTSLSVDIANPTNGEIFPTPTNIQLIAGVRASNDYPITVEFFDNGKTIGVVSNGAVIDPPGSPGLTPGSLAYFFDWTNQTVGTHVLTAVASDTNGYSVTSDSVLIFVENRAYSPPVTVRITSPPNMFTFRSPVNVSLLAYVQPPQLAVSNVEFFAGSNALGFGAPLSALSSPIGPTPPGRPNVLSNTFSFTWTNPAPGDYALTAVALETAGDSSTSAPVNITILPPHSSPSNAPDVISIVATDPIAVAGTNCWTWLGGPLSWSNWQSPASIWTRITNCGPNDATFSVFRRGNTNNDLIVNYTIGGTATNGADYLTLPGSVTIPAGQAEADITLVPIYAASNLSSTVILTLETATNQPPSYQLGFPHGAEALIIDNVGPRAVGGGALLPDHSFHLSLTGPDGAWFHIDYSTDLVNWTPICTNQVVNGSIDFVDPDASSSSERVYRTVPLSGPPQN